jgi:1-acyl-sn-glycerol-3-phosphate acyltransferase
MPHPWLNLSVPYQLGYWTSFWCLHLGWRARAWHRERIPPAGPMLIVANHLSHLDPPLVGMAVGRRATYLARHTLFKVPGFGWMIRQLGAFPIDRDAGKDGLTAVLKLLEAGHRVLMFPEGTRSESGEMMPFKPGVALIAKKANCPVVPAGVLGTFGAWPRGAKVPRPAWAGGTPVGVNFGHPVPAGYYATMKREAVVADLEARVRAALAEGEAMNAKR